MLSKQRKRADQQTAFKTLKDKLPILRYLCLDFSKALVLVSYASVDGNGAALMQRDDDGQANPIGYASKCTTLAEKKRSIS